MKLTILKHKIMIIILSLLFIPVMVMSVYNVDYVLISPGFNSRVETTLIINYEYKAEGSFHTTSVLSIDGITYLQYILGNIVPSASVEPFPKYYNHVEIEDLQAMSDLLKVDSISTSLVVGILNSEWMINHPLQTIDYTSYETVYLTWDFLDENTLEIGDKILGIELNQIPIELDDIPCLSTVNITVLRGEEELEFEVTKKEYEETYCGIGVYTNPLTTFLTADLDFSLIDNNTSGPSGGLLQSLYIYNQLSVFDYTYGLKISGTGTIRLDGSVGAIGGIEQKIYTSVGNDIDIFFVPFEGGNYDRAIEVFNTLDSDMIIVGVNTFSEAVDFLLTYESGDSND